MTAARSRAGVGAPSHGPAPTPAQPRRRRVTLATERDYQNTILGAGRILGWRTAHFRPARTNYGWRTAVGGDGAGFPDLCMVHPTGGYVWFVELKRDDAPKLRPEQDDWRRDLIAAGAVHIVLRVPSGLEQFLDDMAVTSRHPKRAES